MSLRTPVNTAVGGTVITYAAADVAGDSYLNNGFQKVRFKNSTGAPLTVNVDSPNASNFGVVSNDNDIVLTVPANSEITAGPFTQARHNDVNGNVQMTYPGGVTGLTLVVTN